MAVLFAENAEARKWMDQCHLLEGRAREIERDIVTLQTTANALKDAADVCRAKAENAIAGKKD